MSTAIFAAALVLVCGLTVFTGLAPMRFMAHDNFFLLDNAYRVAQGQVPHRDFSSAWGPVIYLVDAVGLFLSGMRPDGLAYANAVFGALIGIWAYGIGRVRLSSPAACWMGIYTPLLIMSPFSLGFRPLMFSEAMIYNRYGYALLGIILVECCCHAMGNATGVADERKGAISSGAALAVLGFLKISFAMMAVPFLLFSLLRSSGRNKRLLTFGAAFGLVAFLFSSYLRFDLGDMFRDLAMAAHARSGSWRPGEILGVVFGKESAPLVLLWIAVALANRARAREESEWPIRELLMVLITLGVGGVLISTNNQPGTLPLTVFAALVLADASLLRLGSDGQPDVRTLAVVLLAAFCALPAGMLDAVSVAAAAQANLQQDAPAVRLASARGASVNLAPVMSTWTTETGGPAYARVLNEGLDLLGRRTKAPVGVLTIDMMNPFNYLMGRNPPRGGMAAAAYTLVFNRAFHPSDDRFFGDAQFVLVRKYSRDVSDFATEQYHIDGLLRIYRVALESRFELLEETPHWQLYGPLRVR